MKEAVFWLLQRPEALERLTFEAGQNEKLRKPFSHEKRWKSTARSLFLDFCRDLKRSSGWLSKLDIEKRKQPFRREGDGRTGPEVVFLTSATF